MELDFSFLDTVGEYASKAFDWMEANPNATKFLGGAAVAGLQYMDSQDQRKHDEKMYNRRQQDSMASSSSGADGYGSHTAKLSGGTGLLTNGLLTKR